MTGCRTRGGRSPAGLAAGVAADALFGDPRRGHPVAAFGRAAAALEARDYADSRGAAPPTPAACVLAVAAPAALLHRRTRRWPPLEAAAVAAAVWAVTGARSLHHEAERVSVSLARHDLAAARDVLPSLCGRDPAGLNGGEIARAVIESVAENTSDAVVAPLLWGAVAGIPGLVAYRAVNTLDAMVGYRSARYLRFGWAVGPPGRRGQLAPGPRHRRAGRGLRAAGGGRPALPGCSGSRSATAGAIRARTRAAARRPSPPRSASAWAGRTSTAAWPRRARNWGREHPGTGRHPPRDRLVPGGHRGRDRPGRAPRAPSSLVRPG